MGNTLSREHRSHPSAAAHVVLSWESSVVVGVHVDHCIRLHHDWRLRFVFHPSLAGERQSDLVHHGTAQRPLGKKGGCGEGSEKEKRGKGRGVNALALNCSDSRECRQSKEHKMDKNIYVGLILVCLHCVHVHGCHQYQTATPPCVEFTQFIVSVSKKFGVRTCNYFLNMTQINDLQQQRRS